MRPANKPVVRAVFALLLCLVCAAATVTQGVLNVHVVGHSHDDPGWLKTVDQYYSGHNGTIYNAQVQYIFDSVINELQKDDRRKFTFCEISFFSRWFYEQTPRMRATVKSMVKSGQLTFVNGGWVMHDEASAHYVSMIDQTTLGHQFLKKEFDFVPTVGWQIDPFGHSRTHAWLSSEVGFDALYFGRIDYQDKKKRMAEKTMEFVWSGSTSQPDAQVLSGAFHDGNYGPPEGFCFDTTCGYCRSDPVVADRRLETYNLDSKVADFIHAAWTEHSNSVGSNIMLKLGSDFAWDNARTWFKSLDFLLDAVNKADPRINAFYSTPTDYTKAKAAEGLTWTTKSDDFFPYSDCEHCMWTGYFTSRPGLKLQERTGSMFLQPLKQLSTMSLLSGANTKAGVSADTVKATVAKLTAAVGLLNHHDALTGTSKQHVADDYGRILGIGMTEGEDVVARVLGATVTCRLVNETVCAPSQALSPGQQMIVSVYNPLARVRSSQITVPISFPAARVTAFQEDKSENTIVQSTVLPSWGQSPNEQAAPFVLTFAADALPALSTRVYTVEVFEDLNNNIQKAAPASKVTHTTAADGTITIANGLVTVAFDAVTGLMTTISRDDVGISAAVSNDLASYESFGSAAHEAALLASTPKLDDKRDPHLMNIVPHISAWGDSSSTQLSGAYIFRPSADDDVPASIRTEGTTAVSVTVVQGDGVVEVRQSFGSWANQTVRLREGSHMVELEWSVGPVPVDGVNGREVVSKFTSNLNSGPVGANKVFTDSNGREFLERTFNYRPTWDLEVFEPVAGNYYPITAGMYVVDNDANLQLSIVPDRAQAGASLQPGSLELMIHRRLTQDDHRGVTEPLDETTGGITHYPNPKRIGDGVTFSGKHYLLLSKAETGVRELRQAMDEVFSAPVVFYSASQDKTAASQHPSSSFPKPLGLGMDLPVNVHLLSLEYLDEHASSFGTGSVDVAVRLAHQFAVNEDSELSADVTVDLAKLFSSFGRQITSVTEMSLSMNQLRSDLVNNKIAWKTAKEKIVKEKNGNAKDQSARSLLRSAGSSDTAITLSPMQIKSFVVSFAN